MVGAFLGGREASLQLGALGIIGGLKRSLGSLFGRGYATVGLFLRGSDDNLGLLLYIKEFIKNIVGRHGTSEEQRQKRRSNLEGQKILEAFQYAEGLFWVLGAQKLSIEFGIIEEPGKSL